MGALTAPAEACVPFATSFNLASDAAAILSQTAAWLDDHADLVERIGIEEPSVYELTRAAASTLRQRATKLRQILLEAKGVLRGNP